MIVKLITRLLTWALFIGCLLGSTCAQALDSVILVANSSHFSLLHRIETAIYSQPSPRPQLLRLEAEELIERKQFDLSCSQRCKLVVAVGSQATQAVLETKAEYPILSILIRKNTYDELVEQFTQLHGQKPNMTALYLDQPLERQLKLIECMLGPKSRKSTLGVLLGPSSSKWQAQLENEMLNSTFKLHAIHVKNQDNAIAALDILLEDVNAIWALPDSAIYNTRTARGLLLSAYRKQVPLIGFSRTYVNNGALAAVYSTPKQIAVQTAEIISNIVTDPKAQLPAPHYPDTFTVAVNYQVARSLGLEIESETTLHYSVKQQEGDSVNTSSCLFTQPNNPKKRG